MLAECDPGAALLDFGRIQVDREEDRHAQKAAIQTGKDMTAQGQTVRYIRSTFVPGEARCMCPFEAPTAQNVRELNDRAKIPYTRVVEALDLTP
jgi:uncharacterized protein DUF4242